MLNQVANIGSSQIILIKQKHVFWRATESFPGDIVIKFYGIPNCIDVEFAKFFLVDFFASLDRFFVECVYVPIKIVYSDVTNAYALTRFTERESICFVVTKKALRLHLHCGALGADWQFWLIHS